MTSPSIFTLVGPDGRPYRSAQRGSLGGHRRSRIYGRLDCRAALQAIARGGYAQHRVFFLDETTAIAAGYRPCAVCMPEKYTAWKNRRLPGADSLLMSAFTRSDASFHAASVAEGSLGRQRKP